MITDSSEGLSDFEVVIIIKGHQIRGKLGTFGQRLARASYVFIDFVCELLDPAKGQPDLTSLLAGAELLALVPVVGMAKTILLRCNKLGTHVPTMSWSNLTSMILP